MLVPVLVLGVMACSSDYSTDSEVDAYIQGAWDSSQTGPINGLAATWLPGIGVAASEVELFFTANEVTIRYPAAGKVFSKPYHVEFSYLDGIEFIDLNYGDMNYTGSYMSLPGSNLASIEYTDYAKIMKYFGIDSNDTRFFRTANFPVYSEANSTWGAPASAAWLQLLGEAFSASAGGTQPTINGHLTAWQIVGKLTIFNYEDRVEIADVGLIYSGTNEDTRIAGGSRLSVFNIRYAEDVPWYMLDLPLRVGLYNVRQRS